MARTKASVGAKVSSGKSSKARCSVAPPSTSSSSSGGGDKASRNHSGGNPMCQRETPKWQKPITNFFICKDGPADASRSDSEDDTAAGSSKSKPKTKRNVIQSDDEEDNAQPTVAVEIHQTPVNSIKPDQEPIVNGEDDQKPENEENEQVNDNGETAVTPVVNGLDDGETIEKPTNRVLDETIELEPLNGEDSHKIDEYYSKNAKGKGRGKKTKGKENLDVNVERRNSMKRDLEEITDEESPHASKKIKVN